MKKVLKKNIKLMDKKVSLYTGEENGNCKCAIVNSKKCGK